MAQRTPQLPQTFPYRLVAGGRALDQRLDAVCWGLYVSNYTAQWVEIPEANEFVPPNTRQIIAMPGVMVARAKFAAPPGINQPSAVAGQTALLTYTERVVQPSGGVVGATAVQSQVTLERFLKANIPVAGNAGRLIQLIDYDQQLWVDTGTVFWDVAGEVFNVNAYAGADLGTKVQAAHDAMPANGGTIYIPTQTTDWSVAVVITKRCVIEGSGMNSSVGQVNAAVVPITFANASVTVLRDWSIVRKPGFAGVISSLIVTTTSQGLRMSRMSIHGANTAEVIVDSFTDCYLDSLILTAEVASAGIGIQTKGTLFASTTFYFLQITATNYAVGIDLTATVDGSIVGGVFTGNTDSVKATGASVFNVNLIGNHAESGGVAGTFLLHLTDAAQTGFTATGNNFGGVPITLLVSLTGGALFTQLYVLPDQPASIVAEVSTVGNAAEITLVSLNVLVNRLRAGVTLRVRAAGTYDSSGGAGITLTFRLKLDATTITTLVVAIPAAALAVQAWNFDGIITIRTGGAGGTLIANGIVWTIGTAAPFVATPVFATTAVDTTAAHTMSLTAQNSSANVNDVTRTENAMIEYAAA